MYFCFSDRDCSGCVLACCCAMWVHRDRSVFDLKGLLLVLLSGCCWAGSRSGAVSRTDVCLRSLIVVLEVGSCRTSNLVTGVMGYDAASQQGTHLQYTIPAHTQPIPRLFNQNDTE